jgi:hypothetical protein
MRRLEPLSGFPEWLPEQRLVELGVLDAIRQQIESTSRWWKSICRLSILAGTQTIFLIVRRTRGGEQRAGAGIVAGVGLYRVQLRRARDQWCASLARQWCVAAQHSRCIQLATLFDADCPNSARMF